MNKTKVVIIIIIIVCIIAGITFIIFRDDTEETGGNDTNYASVTVLENQDEFFALRNIINNYLNVLKTQEIDNLYNMLSVDYIKEYDITVNNVLDYIKYDYYDPIFTATDVLVKSNAEISYYFIKGYIIDYADENAVLYDNTYYIVLVKDQKYNVRPIEINGDFEEFVNDYAFDNTIEINGNNDYNIESIDEESKLTTYIQEFKNILFVDVNKAYDLLDDSSKEYFGSAENLSLYLLNISQNLSPVIFSYSRTEDDESIIYNIIDNNLNNITIYEYNVMNYAIDLKNCNFSV